MFVQKDTEKHKENRTLQVIWKSDFIFRRRWHKCIKLGPVCFWQGAAAAGIFSISETHYSTCTPTRYGTVHGMVLLLRMFKEHGRVVSKANQGYPR